MKVPPAEKLLPFQLKEYDVRHTRPKPIQSPLKLKSIDNLSPSFKEVLEARTQLLAQERGTK
jgi:hypothetical protein